MGGVNPLCSKNTDESQQGTPVEQRARRLPVSAGCAAAPRFIQLHPRLLKLHPLDLATYVLLCERAITGQYPAGVPLSGADLARFFEADDSAAAATRYNRALKRLVDTSLAIRVARAGRKACFIAQWPGTQRREPAPLSTPYPHRLFIPIYLRLYEQFVGTFHPTDTGPARIERFVETPSLDPVALHAWARARWAAWRNEPAPVIEPKVVERLRAIGLWDDAGVYDPEHARQAAVQSPAVRKPANPQPDNSASAATNRQGDNPSVRGAAWAMLDLMAQQMRLMQQQIAAMQQILLGDISTPITAVTTDQVPNISLGRPADAGNMVSDSTNTDSNNNTEINNTDQTQEHLHPQTPRRARHRAGGGGQQTRIRAAVETESERLLRQAGVIASNAQRFAQRRPEQVTAAINFAKDSRRRFDDPAGMIVWLLEKNEFADAHEHSGITTANGEALERCWYCGKPGCTTCGAEQEQRLLVRWGGAEFDGGALWRDLQAVAREVMPELPVDAAEASVVRRERLILIADEEPAMLLRAARHRLIDLAAKRLGVRIDVVITRRRQAIVPLPLPLPSPPLQSASSASFSIRDCSAGGYVEREASHTTEKRCAEQFPECEDSRTSHEQNDPLACAGSPDDALQAAAAPGDTERCCLLANSPMAAERLRKRPAVAERVVGEALGRPVRVTIRSPERPRSTVRRSLWK
jgi:hypothetical protein